jgi:hypothetical protein
VIAQRAPETEEVTGASLRPVGCEALVHARILDGQEVWVIPEGVRWIALASVGVAPERYRIARVTPAGRGTGDSGEVNALAEDLRARARELARALPGAAHVLASLDALGPEPLADLVIANLSAPVADKARCAAEPRLAERLRLTSALMDGDGADGAGTIAARAGSHGLGSSAARAEDISTRAEVVETRRGCSISGSPRRERRWGAESPIHAGRASSQELSGNVLGRLSGTGGERALGRGGRRRSARSHARGWLVAARRAGGWGWREWSCTGVDP